MKSTHLLVALVQQMNADGLRVACRSPLMVTGPKPLALRYQRVVAHLRQNFRGVDEKLARILGPSGGIRWPAVTPEVWTRQEEELLSLLGQMVWTRDTVFQYGRLEAVLPAIAFVTPRPAVLTPPEDPVLAFRERVRSAVPFAVELVEAAAG